MSPLLPNSSASIRIPTPLRRFTAGQSEVPVAGSTVRQAFDDLTERHPSLRASLMTEAGELRTFVSVFIGSQDLRSQGGLDAPLPEGVVVSIVPAVAGGNPGEGR